MLASHRPMPFLEKFPSADGVFRQGQWTPASIQDDADGAARYLAREMPSGSRADVCAARGLKDETSALTFRQLENFESALFEFGFSFYAVFANQMGFENRRPVSRGTDGRDDGCERGERARIQNLDGQNAGFVGCRAEERHEMIGIQDNRCDSRRLYRIEEHEQTLP